MKSHPTSSDPGSPRREDTPAAEASKEDGSGTSEPPTTAASDSATDLSLVDGPVDDARQASELLPLVYHELRRLAARRLSGENREHTLQPTALVHEAWVRLAGSGDRTWRNRQHFLATAAEAMRRILVDRARRRQAAKRGGHPQRLDLEDLSLAAPDEDDRLLAVNEALERFARIDPRKAELVRLRYFADLSFEEAADVLGIAVPTAKQWMAYARAWLKVEMTRPDGGSPPSSPSDPGGPKQPV